MLNSVGSVIANARLCHLESDRLAGLYSFIGSLGWEHICAMPAPIHHWWALSLVIWKFGREARGARRDTWRCQICVDKLKNIDNCVEKTASQWRGLR